MVEESDDEDAEVKVNVQATVHDDFPGLLTLWVGPEESDYALRAMTIPSESVDNPEIREEANRLAVKIYLDYMENMEYQTDCLPIVEDEIEREPS